MSAPFERRLLFVFAALSAVTCFSVWSSRMDGAQALTPNTAIASTAVAIALVKTRIIFREFMEVRHAPARLGRLTDAWLLLTAASLLGSYFVGTAWAGG